MFKIITHDEWVETYKPTTEEAFEDKPDVPSDTLWTEVECDGYFTIASGDHWVNRTGRYWVTEISHEFDVDVEDGQCPEEEE